MPAISKSDLIRKVVARTGRSNQEVSEIVTATLDAIKESLSEGNDVRLLNFGVFAVRRTASRPSVHPGTGEPITIPEKLRVRFMPGKEMSESVASLDDSE